MTSNETTLSDIQIKKSRQLGTVFDRSLIYSKHNYLWILTEQWRNVCLSAILLLPKIRNQFEQNTEISCQSISVGEKVVRSLKEDK